MNLRSFGCSFVYGTDLSDAVDTLTASKLTWPALLARRLGFNYHCHAGGGQGNLAVLDRLSQQICNDPSAVFVVQWTYIDRFDYSDPHGHHFNCGINDWRAVLPTAGTAQSKMYYNFLHSEYRDKLTALIYVKTAIDLLQQHGCRFVMTYLDSLLICDQWHISEPMRGWQEYIAPYLCSFDGQDFLTWSRNKGYAASDSGHPLEPAHEAAADLMLPVIESILRRA